MIYGLRDACINFCLYIKSTT
uniref:Uncharacterized protein n=1 Tax=Rhizophora mucronata TaxID=61149 RepID=A0A2P2P8L7_RHIMU